MEKICLELNICLELDFADVAYLQSNISLNIIYASKGEIDLNGIWTDMKHFLIMYLI